ncbi:hypothetical protein AAVH_40686, partial [Aphelenchoides avenae]
MCLAKFFIRYNNYSADAYERFVNNVATYLYEEIILHGLYIPYQPAHPSEVSAAERKRRKEWVQVKVATIGTGMLEARPIIDDTPPTKQLKQVAAEAEHRSGAVDQTEEPFFDVLVYYPAYDSTEHCVKNASGHVLHGRVKNVNYVVSLRKHLNSNATIETRSKLEEYFKKSKESNECERINEINASMENHLLGVDGIRALVSIKCARKFVWYELAYQYFQAAYTEAPKVETDP